LTQSHCFYHCWNQSVKDSLELIRGYASQAEECYDIGQDWQGQADLATFDSGLYSG